MSSISGIAPAPTTSRRRGLSIGRAAAVAAIAVSLSIVGVPSTAIAPAGGGSSGRIVTVLRPREVVAFSPNGGGPHVLRKIRNGEIIGPAASADGSRIAFVVERDPRPAENNPDVLILKSEVWLMRADGSHAHTIFSTIRKKAPGRGIFYPPPGTLGGRQGIESLDISDDGSRLIIAYYDRLYVIDADGHHLRRVQTRGAAPQGFVGDDCCGPRFAPGGRIIGHFANKRTEGIGTVPVGGGRVRFLTDYGFAGAYSDDGRLIAFVAPRPAEIGATRESDAIWVMEGDGSHAHPLIEQRKTAFANPDFSPDGRHLVFNGYAQLHDGIYVGKTPSNTYVMGLHGVKARRIGTGVAGFNYPNPQWTR